jgi:hypothetical protein
VVVVEVDEHQHVDYDCERRRVMEISKDLDHRPLIVIRFNPDRYTDGYGRRHKSPWTLTPKTKEPRVKVGKDKQEWESRLDRLRSEIAETILDPSKKTLRERRMFYDGHCPE